MDSYVPLTLHAPLPKPSLHPNIISPTIHSQQVPGSIPPPPPPPDQASQAVAVSMRRKKNADAQAAFRARRANYIASLEETVTSLEAVVLSLQDTCGEVRNEAGALRRENARLNSTIECLKQAGRDRERQWREFWQTKQQALGLDDSHFNDMPPTTNIFQSSVMSSRQYGDDGFRYQNGGSSHTQTDPYGVTPARELDQRYVTSQQQYTTSPDGTWHPGPFSNSRTPCLGDAHPSHSPSSSDSPQSLSPNVHYISRFPVHDDNRVSLINVNMPGNTYDSNTSVIQESYSPDDYHHTRHISDIERYAPRPRRSYSETQSRTNGFYSADVSQTESEGLNGEGGLNDVGHSTRPRRHTTASLGHGPPSSHSPSSSPSPCDKDHDREPPMSNTLAMIKAQAFGSLRRTRPKPKKGAEAASKVAVDLLTARGIGMGVQQPSDVRLTLKRKAGDIDDMNVHP